MIYLTKEWFIKYNLSFAADAIHISKNAEMFNEAFYQKLYQRKCKMFVDNDSKQEFFRDPQEDLKYYDDLISDSTIYEEMKRAILLHKKVDLEVNKQRYESGTFFEFDEMFSKEMFEIRQKQLIKLYLYLPQYILDEIPDIRVLALGYTSKYIKNMIKEYAKELRRESNKLLDKAQRESNKAEKMLDKCIGVNEYGEIMLERIYKSGSNVMLQFDCGTLKFVDGEVIEREVNRLNRYDKSKPYPVWSMVMRAELAHKNDRFELHLLIENLSKKERSKIWYLTVGGTDIIECSGSSLSYNPFVK